MHQEIQVGFPVKAQAWVVGFIALQEAADKMDVSNSPSPSKINRNILKERARERVQLVELIHYLILYFGLYINDRISAEF